MKEKNFLYEFLLASFAMIVPFPGRFAYGIILVIVLAFEMLSISLFKQLVKKLSLDNMLSILTAVLLISESIIFKQFLIMYSPILALTLSFDIYFPAVSAFIISRLTADDSKSMNVEFISDTIVTETKLNMEKTLRFSILALFIFAFRDIFGYGTLTLPARKGLASLMIFHDTEKSAIGALFASIPGAILILLACLFFIMYIEKNLKVAGGIANDDDK